MLVVVVVVVVVVRGEIIVEGHRNCTWNDFSCRGGHVFQSSHGEALTNISHKNWKFNIHISSKFICSIFDLCNVILDKEIEDNKA